MEDRLKVLRPELVSAITSLELASYLMDSKLQPRQRIRWPYTVHGATDCARWVWDAVRSLPALARIVVHYGATPVHLRDLNRALGREIARGGWAELQKSSFQNWPVPVIQKTEHRGILSVVWDSRPNRLVFISNKEFLPAHIASVRAAGLRLVEAVDDRLRMKEPDETGIGGDDITFETLQDASLSTNLRKSTTLRATYIVWVSQIDDLKMEKLLNKNMQPTHELRYSNTMRSILQAC